MELGADGTFIGHNGYILRLLFKDASFLMKLSFMMVKYALFWVRVALF